MNINKYEFENKVIDLEKVPPLSYSTCEFLKREGQIGNVKTGTLTELKVDAVSSKLKELSEDLDLVKNHPNIDKFFAISRSLFAASALAAGVLGVLYTGFPILCGVAAAIIYYSAGIENARREGIRNFLNIWHFGLLTVGSAIIPLYGLIDKKNKLMSRISLEDMVLCFHLKQRDDLFKADFSHTIKKLTDASVNPKYGENANSIAKTVLNEINANIAFFNPSTAPTV